MIVVNGQPPPQPVLRFFDQLFPGIWSRVVAAAEFGLNSIDTDQGQTVLTSWHRSPLDNRRVGGDPDSQHLVGLAFDVVPGKGTSLLAINEAAERFKEAGFEVAPAATHLHVQVFPAGLLRASGVFDHLGL